jgi:hypothetical protein
MFRKVLTGIAITIGVLFIGTMLFQRFNGDPNYLLKKGAVVLKEVPPYATVVGVPGRIVRIRTPENEDVHSGIIAVAALNKELSKEEIEKREEEAKAAAEIAEKERSQKK